MRAIFTQNGRGKPLFAQQKRAVMIFFMWQILIALVICVLFAIFSGHKVAFSVLQGDILAIAPALFLSLWFFWRLPGNTANAKRDVYLAEFLKIALICALFLVMLRYGHIQFLPFMAGFCGTYAAYFLAPFVIK